MTIHSVPKEPRFKLQPFKSVSAGSEAVYLIKGIIPRVGITIVWGPSKSGKTFLILDLMMHITLDWEYRGRRVHGGAVVYLAFEGAYGLRARIEAFRQEFLRPDDDPQFYLVEADVSSLAKDHQDIIRDIRAQIGRPVAVVLDTLNRSLGGDENAGKDVTAYINAASAICTTLECAVIIIHHCGWDENRMRGFSGLTGNTDCQIAVKKQGGVTVATVVAAKDMPEGEQVASTLRQVSIGQDQDGEPITSCVVEEADMPAVPQARWKGGLIVLRKAVLEALHKHGHDHRVAGDGPTVKAVAIKHARTEHRRLYLHGGDGDRDEAEGKAWRRGIKKAQEMHLIGSENELVWLLS
jgi:hypothetical protein